MQVQDDDEEEEELEPLPVTPTKSSPEESPKTTEWILPYSIRNVIL